MSLIAFLKQPDVRQKFRETFKVPKMTAQKQMAVQLPEKRAALIGTAFDYLFRFFLQHLLNLA